MSKLKNKRNQRNRKRRSRNRGSNYISWNKTPQSSPLEDVVAAINSLKGLSFEVHIPGWAEDVSHLQEVNEEYTNAKKPLSLSDPSNRDGSGT